MDTICELSTKLTVLVRKATDWLAGIKARGIIDYLRRTMPLGMSGTIREAVQRILSLAMVVSCSHTLSARNCLRDKMKIAQKARRIR